ncbi:MAG: flagellar hook-basal body complex protein FliE [Bacillota bacterium]
MTIQTNFIQPITSPTIKPQATTEPKANSATFKNMLTDALNDVNQLQLDSQAKTEQLVNGEIDDLHDVMITAQKASVGLNLAVEVQSKAITAYNEMMRMQL